MEQETLSPRSAVLINLWLVSEQLSQRVDHSLGAVHGIAYVEFMVLLQLSLAPSGHMRRIDLANAVGRSASGITRLLRPMEKTGLIERASSGRDARVSLVKLTEAGWEKLHDAIPSIEALGERLTRVVGDSQLDSLATALTALKD